MTGVKRRRWEEGWSVRRRVRGVGVERRRVGDIGERCCREICWRMIEREEVA
jgi:hypothetical protein